MRSDKVFGPFRLNPSTGELWKAGVRIRLPDQPARLLIALVDEPGEILTREALRKRLWPEDTFVDFDRALTANVKKLRGALNDSPKRPRYIETLPKRGYRFIAEVQDLPVESAPPSQVSPERNTAPSSVPPQTRTQPIRTQRNLAVIGLITVSVLATWMATTWPALPTTPYRRMGIAEQATPNPRMRDVAISPDGRMVAYVSPETPNPIWVRELDEDASRKLEGTAGTQGLFWSPDSQDLAFANQSELRRISSSGGPALLVSKLPGLRFAGGSWSPDGDKIVFAADTPGVLFEVDAGGGTPRQIFDEVADGPAGANRDPWFVNAPGEPPALVFTAGADPSDFRLFVRRIEGGGPIELAPGRLPVASQTGHIIYQALGAQGGVWALPFSSDKLAAVGAPFPVEAEGLSPTVATDGTLVFKEAVGAEMVRLVVRDRRGGVLNEIAAMDRIVGPAISPDGTRVAFAARQNDISDIWVQNLESGVRSRISSVETPDFQPVWSTDGSVIAWRSDVSGNAEIVWRPEDKSSGVSPLISTDAGDRPWGWTPDGQQFVFTSFDFATGSDVWLAKVGSARASKLTPALNSEFQEISPRVSPDGRLLAYCSDETGKYQVYVRPFPTGADVQRVEGSGGCEPRWASGGKELFYLSDKELMVVPVSSSRELKLGSPAAILSREHLVDSGLLSSGSYDVWPDGQRLVVLEPERSVGTLSQIRIVQGWGSQVAK